MSPRDLSLFMWSLPITSSQTAKELGISHKKLAGYLCGRYDQQQVPEALQVKAKKLDKKLALGYF